MKTNFCFLVISLLCWQGFVSAQVVDDFSDGDLSNNPAWNGETALFQVNSAFELQSNGNPANDTIYLSTPNTRLNDTEWRFRIRYNFGPSTTNNLRVYLVSDQSDLEGDLQGYFLRVGESGTSDSYDLYRQDGSNLVQMIDGIDGRAGSNIDALVKISRDGMGNWSLATDTDNSGVFTLEGNVFDDTYASTAHTGFWVKHSSTRNQSFFFDDFYIGDPILDLSPPVLQSVVPQSATELLLTFDENLDLSSSEDVNHYSINQGIGNPLLAERDGNNETEVLLTLAAPLQNGQSYQLSVLDVMDQNGNGIDPAQQFDFSFLIPEQAIFKDIIFHEIMPDPSPVVNLPEVEYIELHNRSDKIIDLAAWTLSNGSSVASLPSYILTPGDYVVLLKNADINAFTFNNKIVTSSSVALVNGGDNLGLRDANGTLIDTLDYLQIWHEPAKADGGYSLEIIDPDELDCPPRSNWSSSVDTRGGSPGIFNSLAPIPDTEAPVIQTFQVLSPTLIRICFNEAMDPVGLVDESQYTIDQGIGIPSNAVVLEPDRLCVDLSLSGSLQQGTIYTLTVGSVQDCKGNELGGDKSLMIVRGRPPLANDIVITEFMADPTPRLGLPEAEFIELYNRSDDVIDLNGYQLSDGNAEASLDNALLFPGEYGIVCSINDSAAFVPFGKIFPVFGLPGLGNSQDTIRLLDPFFAPLDEVYYDDSWYRDVDKKTGGYSLERIDPDFLGCNQSLNWRASDDPSGGSPGRENSILGNYTDRGRPSIQQLKVLSDFQIAIVFSEQMDESSLESTNAYDIDQNIGNPLISQSLAPLLQEVQLTFDQSLAPATIYTLRIQGLLDCSGNPLDTTLQIGLPGIPEPGDVLINEILFNPLTGGQDYVEITNVSDQIIDLSQLRIGEGFVGNDSIFNDNSISEESRLMLPGDILCLTRDVAIQKQIYFPPPSALFLETDDFPSYDDREGVCVIFDLNGSVLDKFAYLDDFHFPTLVDDDGVSLERISLQVPAAQNDNWHSAAASVNYGTPGYANSQILELSESPSAVRLEPETFSPDDDGVDDVIAIQYNLDFPGGNVRINVLDARGRLVRTLVQNILTSPQEGTFFWDGADDKGTKADIGIYIIQFEVSNAQTGEWQAFRLPCVLAARL